MTEAVSDGVGRPGVDSGAGSRSQAMALTAALRTSQQMCCARPAACRVDRTARAIPSQLQTRRCFTRLAKRLFPSSDAIALVGLGKRLRHILPLVAAAFAVVGRSEGRNPGLLTVGRESNMSLPAHQTP